MVDSEVLRNPPLRQAAKRYGHCKLTLQISIYMEIMKGKLLNILLVVASLIGYLEWGKDNKSFLIEAEFELLKKMFTDPISAVHPFTLIPLLGQILLLITLFQNAPSRKLTYLGISSIGLLLVFMFFIGIIGLNLKILASTLPFIVISILTIKYQRSLYNENSNA
ncbi:MAG: hypothetical protein Fur0023_22490 [Bacteroidia bacterium]